MTDVPDEMLVVRKAVEKIAPILAGLPGPIQGAALADLLSMWLAGHTIANSAAMTDRLREEILQMHMEAVRELVPVSAKQIGLPH